MIDFSQLHLHNNCEFDLYVTGHQRGSPGASKGVLPAGAQVLYTGKEDFVPLKAIFPGSPDAQRIEVSRAQSSNDELDLVWIEFSQNLREKAGGGYSFAGPVALNFATQSHVSDVGIEAMLADASGAAIVDRPASQADPAAFAKARFQGSVQGCLQATQAKGGSPQTAVAHLTEAGFQVCAPICPGDVNAPLWRYTNQACEGCVLKNEYVKTDWGGYWTVADEQDYNSFAKYGSDNSCAWRGGRWVSAPRTVTTRENYLQSGGTERHREFDPSRQVPYKGGHHGLPADWSPNFECWDPMGTGPEGFPVSATKEEWGRLHSLDVTFCPTPVVCERPVKDISGIGS